MFYTVHVKDTYSYEESLEQAMKVAQDYASRGIEVIVREWLNGKIIFEKK